MARADRLIAILMGHCFAAFEDRGDRDLAERLLYEIGMDPNFRDEVPPEAVEVLVGTGKITTYDPTLCPICYATRGDCGESLYDH